MTTPVLATVQTDVSAEENVTVEPVLPPEPETVMPEVAPKVTLDLVVLAVKAACDAFAMMMDAVDEAEL